MPSTVTCHGVPSGQTLTAKLFADGGDTEIDAGSFAFATNRKGSGTFSANVTGLHKIELRTSGGVLFWFGFAVLATSGSIEASETREQAMLNTMIEASGGQYRFDEPALAQAPAGGGGGGGLTQDDIDDIAAQTSATVVATLGGVSGSASCDEVRPGGKLTIKRGDDYYAADGFPLSW